MDHLDKNGESDFDKKLEELHREIREGQEDIRDLRKELREEEEDLDELEEKLEDLKDEHEQEHGHGHDHGGNHPKNEIKLIFIVNGSPTHERVKLSQTLLSVVELVLKKTGNGGRPVSDWTVKFKEKALDTSQTIKELKLPDCAELFLSLNAGTGG